MMLCKLDELTRADLLRDVEKKVERRAKSLQPATYIGITSDYTIHMDVPSATGSGSYLVKIQLVEYPTLLRMDDLLTTDKVRLAIVGDLKVHCNCKAFLYWGYDYITTQLDANTKGKQTIFPKVRNPLLEGVCCKHIYRAMKRFGSYWLRIAKDIDQRNFIK